MLFIHTEQETLFNICVKQQGCLKLIMCTFLLKKLLCICSQRTAVRTLHYVSLSHWLLPSELFRSILVSMDDLTNLVPDFRQRFGCLVTILIFMISCFWDFSQHSLCCRLVCLRNETSTHSLSRVIRRSCSPNVLRSDGLAFICI